MKPNNLENLNPEFETVTRKSLLDKKEYGFALCKVAGEVISGEHSIGGKGSVTIDSCKIGEEIGSFHTHPGEKPEPSVSDLELAEENGLDILCLSSGEIDYDELSGVAKCYSVKENIGKNLKRYYSKRYEVATYAHKKEYKEKVKEDFDFDFDFYEPEVPDRPDAIKKGESWRDARERLQKNLRDSSLEEIHEHEFVQRL